MLNLFGVEAFNLHHLNAVDRDQFGDSFEEFKFRDGRFKVLGEEVRLECVIDDPVDQQLVALE